MAYDTIPEQLKRNNIRTGALACIVALHEVLQIADNANDPELSIDGYLKYKELANQALIGNSETVDPYLAGFIATLAEYIFDVHTAGVPNLSKWKSLAAMTEDQRVANKRELELAALE